MKSIRLFLAVAALLTCCSTIRASGCTDLSYFKSGDDRVYGTAYGIQYIDTETVSYQVTCTNSNNGSTVYSTNNSASAHGTAADAGGIVSACAPTFAIIVYPGDSFDNQGYNAVTTNIPSGSACAEGPLNQDNASTCPYVACSNCPQCPRQKVCTSGCSSPIVLDVSGQGFFLTSAQGGVMFDISGDGIRGQMAWTAPGAYNAFLSLPAPDGLVHNGKQLFGNYTPQPASDHPNGFIALAVYDLPANGGNGDGIIDARDAIFSSLRLWVDSNHDGISQPNELYTLTALGISSISLSYKAEEKTDQYGNIFHYRAQVNPGNPTDVGKSAYDIFFVEQNPTQTAACPVPATMHSFPSILKR